MGKNWQIIKNWFATNKALKVLSEYLGARLKDKVEILMRSFGALLTTWTIALFGSFIALISGLDPNWAVSIGTGLGATSLFLVQFYRVAFGASKNGNDNTTPT